MGISVSLDDVNGVFPIGREDVEEIKECSMQLKASVIPHRA